MRFTRLLLLVTTAALPSLSLAKGSKYCTGSFAATTSICSKFDFKSMKDDGACTSSADAKKDEKNFHGIPLANCTTFYDISSLPNESMTPSAVKMAELITNVFENGNTKMGYAAAERLGDCRGYTCGYVGFTTGTNDAYAVIREYIKRVPKNNAFSKYVPVLQTLSNYSFGDPRRDDTSKLPNFAQVWKSTSCSDANFVQTQLDVGQSMYMLPALKYAASAGVTSNLGKAIFYDTIIQHGWQYVEPLINLPRIILITGPKKKGESEQSYLTRFVTTRRQLVCCFPGAVWQDSADRLQDLQTLLDNWSNNSDLSKPVKLVIYGETVTGTEDISYDSHACKSKPSGSAKATTLSTPDHCNAY